MTKYTYNNRHKDQSRKLRRRQTEVEKLLWSRLRGRQLNNLKFRRQHPINTYVLDFYCETLKLAIELDGGFHTKIKQHDYDVRRTQALNNMGVKVMRFWNSEVLEDLDDVVERIKMFIEKYCNTASSTGPHPPVPLLKEREEKGINPKK